MSAEEVAKKEEEEEDEEEEEKDNGKEKATGEGGDEITDLSNRCVDMTRLHWNFCQLKNQL